MKPEIKRRWLEALRSGKYKQGRERLRKGDAFCCLGVLCDLAREDGVGDWRESDVVGALDFACHGDDYTSPALLPRDVAQWSELHVTNPYISECKAHLVTINDHGRSFTEIADLIEKYL